MDDNSCFDFLLSTMDHAGLFFIHPVQDETTRLDSIHQEVQRHTLTMPQERQVVPGTAWAVLDGVQHK